MGYKVINLPLHHSEIKTRASLLWCFWDLISLWSIYTHCYLVLMWSNYFKRGRGDGCGRWCCSLNNWVPMFPNLRFLTKKNIIKKILNFEFIEKWWKTVVPLRFLHSSTLFIPINLIIPQENLGTILWRLLLKHSKNNRIRPPTPTVT